MIGATKRLLIETLLDLALGEETNTEEGDLQDYLRAIFLLASSHSIVDIPHAERISYETYEDYETGLLQHISGMAVPASGMFISDVVRNLRQLTKVPEELVKTAPDLSYNDFQAALYAIDCILVCLQWDEVLESYEKRYSQEKKRKKIASSLRSLRSYRETGEP